MRSDVILLEYVVFLKNIFYEVENSYRIVHFEWKVQNCFFIISLPLHTQKKAILYVPEKRSHFADPGKWAIATFWKKGF